MTENRPAEGITAQMFGDLPVRHFGRTIQMSASIDAHGATATNWAQTCKSLQEKINLLALEMETLKEQNEHLTRKCSRLECQTSCDSVQIQCLRTRLDLIEMENRMLQQNLTPIPQPSLRLNQGRRILARDIPGIIDLTMDE